MKHLLVKRILAALLALLLACTVCACNGEQDSQLVDTNSSESNPAVIRINGKDDLYRNQFIELFDSAATQIQTLYGVDLTDEANVEVLKNVRDQCIAAYVTKRVEILKAQELGLDQLTQLEIEQAAEEVNKQYEHYHQQFYDQLVEQGMDADALVDQVMEQYGVNAVSLSSDVQTTLILDKLKAHVLENFQATEEEYEAVYQDALENQKETIQAEASAFVSYWNGGVLPLYRPQGYYAYTWVLVPIDAQTMTTLNQLKAQGDESYDAQLQKALEKILPQAKQAAEDIAADPAKFEQYRSKYGMGDNFDSENLPQNQGYCIAAGGVFNQAVADAAQALETDGAISALVAGTNGYYIIRREGAIQSGEMSYDQAKDVIRSYADASLRETAYNEQVMKWIEETEIEILYENMQ